MLRSLTSAPSLRNHSSVPIKPLRSPASAAHHFSGLPGAGKHTKWGPPILPARNSTFRPTGHDHDAPDAVEHDGFGEVPREG